MKDFKTLKKELLKNPEIRRVYSDLKPEYTLIEMIIQKRLEKGLTQEQLANKIDTKQSAISRLEGGQFNPTFSLLNRVAKALGTNVHISLN